MCTDIVSASLVYAINCTYCLTPVTVKNALVTLHWDQFGIVATVVCLTGHVFDEGGTSRTIICLQGHWHAEITECIGLAYRMFICSFI